MSTADKFLLNERLRLHGSLADLDQELASGAPGVFKETRCATTIETFTECASKIGIAVSLIEGIIATSRILWMMDLSSSEVQEALRDLKDTYELQTLMTSETEAPQGRIHDEKWRKR